MDNFESTFSETNYMLRRAYRTRCNHRNQGWRFAKTKSSKSVKAELAGLTDELSGRLLYEVLAQSDEHLCSLYCGAFTMTEIDTNTLILTWQIKASMSATAERLRMALRHPLAITSYCSQQVWRLSVARTTPSSAVKRSCSHRIKVTQRFIHTKSKINRQPEHSHAFMLIQHDKIKISHILMLNILFGK